MFRFRMTLLMLLGGLILLTLSTVGITSYVNSRSAAYELSGQVLQQTSLRIDQEIDQFLSQATSECHLTRQLIQSGQFQTDRLPHLVHYWREVLTAQPETTGLFLGLEETGEAIGVSRLQSNRLIVWQSIPQTATGAFEIREFYADNFPTQPFKVFTTTEDVRKRPWFAGAKQKRRDVWTPSYVFLGVAGAEHVLGVSYSVPMFDSQGQFQAVVMADFELDTLSRFLGTLRIGQRGSAFLVEQQPNGAMRVIAHPRNNLQLTRPRLEGPGRELTAIEELDDKTVQQLVQRLPARLASGSSDSKLIRFESEDEHFLGSVQSIEQFPGQARPDWLICTFVPEEDILGHAQHTNQVTLSVSICVLAVAALLSLYLSRQVAQPLEKLALGAVAVGQLRLEPRPPIRSIVLEVDQLARAAEEMKSGLRSFEKYLPSDLVRGLLNSGQEAILGVESRVLTMSFSDIVGFTSIAETMPAPELIDHLGEYFDRLSRVILESGGTVDKFIGDAIMAFWGAPLANPRHAAAACLSAHRCRERLRELAPQWNARGRPPLTTRFGLHTGEVLVGNIGSPARMNYTVMGDAVNLASRLEGLNKYYGTEILLSDTTYREAAELLVVRQVDRVAVVGRSEAVAIYELLGLASDEPRHLRQLASRYAEAFHAYQERRWADAIGLLELLLQDFPDDGPGQNLLRRARQFATHPPGEEWDGVNRMTSK